MYNRERELFEAVAEKARQSLEASTKAARISVHVLRAIAEKHPDTRSMVDNAFTAIENALKEE